MEGGRLVLALHQAGGETCSTQCVGILTSRLECLKLVLNNITNVLWSWEELSSLVVTHGSSIDIRRLVSCDVQFVSQTVMLPVLTENDQKLLLQLSLISHQRSNGHHKSNTLHA